MNQTEKATFGSGCFWCTEAIFQRLKGVVKVESGYAGGKVKNPSYREVCTGLTGHAEVIQVTFDPFVISYKDLLEVFFSTHDPTTLNKQGADAGTQYRSVVFYHNEEQRLWAKEFKEQLQASKAYNDPVVTEITAYTEFYPADNHHKDYYNQHETAPYCQYVIAPKLQKFLSHHSEMVAS